MPGASWQSLSPTLERQGAVSLPAYFCGCVPRLAFHRRPLDFSRARTFRALGDHVAKTGVDRVAGNHHRFVRDLKCKDLGFEITIPGDGKYAARGCSTVGIDDDAGLLLHGLLDTSPFFLGDSAKDNGLTCAHSAAP